MSYIGQTPQVGNFVKLDNINVVIKIAPLGAILGTINLVVNYIMLSSLSSFGRS